MNITQPFLFYVWFMENGDDQWRPVAATMDKGDAKAVVKNIENEQSGAAQVLQPDRRPKGLWYI